ncbi:MAG: FapA family protein [Leptospira sp.]|nr:FapA family protein [Leptospira sp.]
MSAEEKAQLPDLLPGVQINPQRALNLDVSPDALTAEITINPARLYGHPLSMTDVYEFLEKSGIAVDKANWELVRTYLEELTKNIKNIMVNPQRIRFEIAKGTPALPGEDGWLKFYHPRARRVVIREDGSADFRNIDRYIHIKKDEKVATLFEGIPGTQGLNVFGKPIYPPLIERPKLTVGNNIIIKKEQQADNPQHVYLEHYSSCDGVIYLTDNSVTVASELQINSDVGLSTGNVNYDGTVKVKGTIEEGSKINCSGSLIVGGNIESDDISVKGDIEAKGGIKPKGKGAIRVGGAIRAKFIENAFIEVSGDLIIEGSILQSKILCLGSVFLTGPTGNIITSEVIAYGGISVMNLGSTAELEASVELGFHFKNDRNYNEGAEKLREMDKEIDTLQPKIQQIKRAVMAARGKLDDEKKKKFKFFFDSYQKKVNDRKTFFDEMENLKVQRYNPENVALVVRGGAFPPSVIRYRRHVEKITVFQSKFMIVFHPGQEKVVKTAWTDKRTGDERRKSEPVNSPIDRRSIAERRADGEDI